MGEGFYPTGTETPANAKKPTGALLKAVIVNGARTINNSEKVGQPLRRGQTPVQTKGKADTVQGQGLVTLMHSLMFPDSPDQFKTVILAGFCPSAGGGAAPGLMPAAVNVKIS